MLFFDGVFHVSGRKDTRHHKPDIDKKCSSLKGGSTLSARLQYTRSEILREGKILLQWMFFPAFKNKKMKEMPSPLAP
jgi:hypothetical protein